MSTKFLDLRRWVQAWMNKETLPYKIRPYSLNCYEYEAEGRRAIIQFEVMMGDIDLVIYSRLLKGWEPPHHHQIFTETDKQIILDRISERLMKQKARFRIE